MWSLLKSKGTSLRELAICECPSLTSMPNVTGLTSLQSLTIWKCEELKTIPDGFLHSLSALEELDIYSCNALKIGATPFPSLRKMSIYGMNAMVVNDSWTNKLSSLTSLSIDGISEFTGFPLAFWQNSKHLLIVKIGSCPKFQGFLSSHMEQQEVLATSLELLEICNCSGALSVDLWGLIRLRELAILGCGGLKSLHGLQYLSALEKLRLGPFSEELDCFPFTIEENGYRLHSLCYLEIFGWSNLKSLPGQLQYITSLSFLRIHNFNGLTELPEWFGKLTLLQKLHIDKCKNLMHLPSVEEMRRLTSLSELYIEDCPILEERCKEETGGAEWHKISHIPFVKFNYGFFHPTLS